jgi:hypothetical protein
MEYKRLTVFFAVLFGLAIAWYISFHWVLTKKVVVVFLRQAGVAASKTQRWGAGRRKLDARGLNDASSRDPGSAFLELKRKSFHLAGALVPIIYFLGAGSLRLL